MEMLISFFMLFAEGVSAGIEHFLEGWHWFEKLLLLTLVLMLAVFVCVFLVLRP
jgi:hypothetical protein